MILLNEETPIEWKNFELFATVGNTWLIFMKHSTSIQDMKLRLSDYLHRNSVHLRFDSQVYTMSYREDGQLVLLEAYKVTPSSSHIIVQEVREENSWIWVRRNNLYGLRLRVAYIIEKPYVFEPEDHLMKDLEVDIDGMTMAGR